MWSAMRALSCVRTVALLASLCVLPPFANTQARAAPAKPASAGVASLDPAFRLPAGGLALSGPVLDSGSSPAAAWLLSEDLSLYALAETGALVTRIDLSRDAGPERPSPFLSIDPFGRAVLAFGSGQLSAFTRIGARAWKAPILRVTGEAAAFPPAFGSDGRAFVLSGNGLVCLNPAGLRLWTLALPSPASCPPGVDGRGNACIGLADGSLLIVSPYGERMRTLSLGSSPRVLFPLCPPAVGMKEPPLLAAGLRDGRILLIGAEGDIPVVHRGNAEPLSLAWDGSLLYGLDASGEAFGLSVDGKVAWSVSTSCLKGRLSLFTNRLVVAGQGRVASLSLGGEVLRELTIPNASGTPVISPAGLAFSSGKDWVLAAYRFEKPLGAPTLPVLPAYPGIPDSVSRILDHDPLSVSSDIQLKRLADIENSLRSGTIGMDEPEAAAYCAAVATGALDRDLTQEERKRLSNPLPRSQACYFLGDLGSPMYREPLFKVLEGDADPAVRGAACEALTAIGVDRDGRSMAAFLAAAARPVDEMTAFVITVAIEGMTLHSGLGPSDDALRALVRLTSKPYGLAVRNRALAALGRIAGKTK